MGLLGRLLGKAGVIDPSKILPEIGPMLVPGEQIEIAFQVVRDLWVFTSTRLILVDKQGITGKKREYHTIPFKSISHFAVETAGRFDLDADLKIWVGSDQTPITKKIAKQIDVPALIQTLSYHVAPYDGDSVARQDPALSIDG